MASGNTEEDGAYHDFTKECEFSTFTLIVEGKPLHILSHSLAPISPYFAKLCFDEKYNEMEKKEAPIPMEKFEDVHEMLQCLSPFYPQRPITGLELNSLIFYFPNLMVSYPPNSSSLVHICPVLVPMGIPPPSILKMPAPGAGGKIICKTYIPRNRPPQARSYASDAFLLMVTPP